MKQDILLLLDSPEGIEQVLTHHGWCYAQDAGIIEVIYVYVQFIFSISYFIKGILKYLI